MIQANFSFISAASGGDQFSVVGFTGKEAISRLYRYEIEIKIAHEAAIDLDDVLDNPARFVIELEGEEFPVYGVLAGIDELQTVQGYVHYRATLVPRLWWLSIYRTNEIYTSEKTIDQIIQLVLENAGFNDDVDFDLGSLVTDDLVQRDYRCQFGESDFDFLCRLMENEGIFFYFDHGGDAEKIVFQNDANYLPMARPELIFETGAQAQRMHESVNAWSCRRQRLPANVTVRDYNPDHPSIDIAGSAAIDAMGMGTEYRYGDNLVDVEEAEILSDIRAQERLCYKTRYHGDSSTPWMRAGYSFNLDMHPNDNYNGLDYLLLEVEHSGRHLDMSVSGGGEKASRSKPEYANSFIALEAAQQFRPARTTPKPRFYGTMTAFIYAEEGTNIAEIDQYGRYRVHLPFDRADGSKESTDPNRKASTWIRKAGDYVGEEKGSYFPLTGGTEVLLSFIHGDPDQPIIVGAVPNASEPSLLNTDNEFESTVQTGSGNKIRMGDVEGEDRILMESPMANSWLRIGETNDPITLRGESPQFVEVGSGAYVDPGAEATDPADPTNPRDVSNVKIKNAWGKEVSEIDTSVPGEYVIKYRDTNNITDVAFRKVVVGIPETYSELTGNVTDGIKIHSVGNLHMEAKSRYGEYYTSPTSIPATPGTGTSADDMRAKFGSAGTYNPTGLLNYGDHSATVSAYQYEADGVTYSTTTVAGKETHVPSSDAKTVDDTLAKAHLKVSSFDTFHTQEGNVYDFGGYWVYNLGNGYVENHIYQQAELNLKHNKPFGGPKAGVVTSAVIGNVITFLPAIPPAIVGIVAFAQGGLGGVLVTSIISAVGIPIISAVSSGVGYGLRSIRPTDIGDLVKGPESGVIASWAYKVGSSFNGENPPRQDEDSLKQKYDYYYPWDILTLEGSYRDKWVDRPMNTKTTWVDKKFGDSYDFKQGNTIEITHGNTESHVAGDVYEYKYGGLRESASFSKGMLSHWERKGAGQKMEASWDSLTGQMQNFKFAYKGFFTFSVTTNVMPTINIALAMSSLDAKAKFSLGTAFDFNMAAAMAMKFDFAAGYYIKLERKIGGELTWNEVTRKREFKAFGLNAAKEEDLKSQVQKLVMERVLMNMSNEKFNSRQMEIGIEMSKMSMRKGNRFYM